MKKVLLTALMLLLPCMIISSGKRRKYILSDKTYTAIKSARDHEFKETNNHDDAKRAYNTGLPQQDTNM